MTEQDDATENAVEMEFTEEKTPAVGRRCADCGDLFRVYADDKAPPGSYAEAWQVPVICKGTADPSLWRWCQVTGDLTMPGRMLVRYFPDRRKGDRRTPPPIPEAAK